MKPARKKKTGRTAGQIAWALTKWLFNRRQRFAPVYLWVALLAGGLLLGGFAPACWWVPLAVACLTASGAWVLAATSWGRRLRTGRAGDTLRAVITFLVPDSMDEGRRGVLDRPAET